MAIATVLGVLVAVMRLSRNPILMAGGFFYCWLLRGIPARAIGLWYNFALLFKYLGLHIGDFDFTIPTNDLMTPFRRRDDRAVAGRNRLYRGDGPRRRVVGGPGPGRGRALLGHDARRGPVAHHPAQALRVLLPPMGNQLIDLLKWTSLASTVGVTKLMLSLQLIYAAISVDPPAHGRGHLVPDHDDDLQHRAAAARAPLRGCGGSLMTRRSHHTGLALRSAEWTGLW